MSTTEAPRWAAAAATVNPPAPAPITQMSTRRSPPVVGASVLLLTVAALSALSSPEPTRIRPTARSFGCCMGGPPFPDGDGNERDEPQESKCQHQFLGDERACMDPELAGFGPLQHHASSVFGLRGHYDAVEARTRRREGESRGNDTEKCGDNVGLERHAQDGRSDIDEPERKRRHQAQEQKVAQRILLEAGAQLGEPGAGARGQAVP